MDPHNSHLVRATPHQPARLPAHARCAQAVLASLRACTASNLPQTCHSHATGGFACVLKTRHSQANGGFLVFPCLDRASGTRTSAGFAGSRPMRFKRSARSRARFSHFSLSFFSLSPLMFLTFLSIFSIVFATRPRHASVQVAACCRGQGLRPCRVRIFSQHYPQLPLVLLEFF